MKVKYKHSKINKSREFMTRFAYLQDILNKFFRLKEKNKLNPYETIECFEGGN